MGKRYSFGITVMVIFSIIMLISGPSASSLTFDNSHADDGIKNAFAQQGQTILPQQAITNPTNVQQSQDPVITSSSVPNNNSIQHVGSANPAINEPTNNGVNPANGDLVMISQSYNVAQPHNTISGKILNNGSAISTFVKITAFFYNVNGMLLGSVMNHSDPFTIQPNSVSSFSILVANDTIKENVNAYDFTLQWRDINGVDRSVRIGQEQIQNTETVNVAINFNSGAANEINKIDYTESTTPVGQCDPSYPDVCIESPPPDLDCPQISDNNFDVVGSDPHGLDNDNDGIGCETATQEDDDQDTDDNVDDSPCDPSYPDVCIESPPPDLDCPQISDNNFDVVGSDPHGLDNDNDGIGCETATQEDDDQDTDDNVDDDEPNDNDNNDNDNNDNGRCPNGSHRSPSGDCEKVTDDSTGQPRCPNGSHRSPSGDCEKVN